MSSRPYDIYTEIPPDAPESSEATAPIDSPALSPPTDEAPSLPELGSGAQDEHDTILSQSTVLPHLIDFTDQHQRAPVPFVAPSDDRLSVIYRSPPFMEAQLPEDPEHAQAPLPMAPTRILERGFGAEEDGLGMMDYYAGHVRSPTLPSRSTSQGPPGSPPSSSSALSAASSIAASVALGSLSRTIRNYSPFPAASHPTNSDTDRPSPFYQEYEREYETEYEDNNADSNTNNTGLHGSAPRSHTSARQPPPSQPIRVPPDTEHDANKPHHQVPRSPVTSGLTQTMRRGSSPLRPVVEYPRASGSGRGEDIDKVLWAHWDRLGTRPVLLLGYSSGLQIWDTSNLSSVSEVLNITATSLSTWASSTASGDTRVVGVIQARILPDVQSGKEGDEPLLGVLLESQARESHQRGAILIIYSLWGDKVVERRTFSGTPQAFECSGRYLIISTSSPAALHIISTTSFETLYTIPASGLATFATKSPHHHHYQHQQLIPPSSIPEHGKHIEHQEQLQEAQPGLRQEGEEKGEGEWDENEMHRYYQQAHRGEVPHPVFALSNRLLAYAVPWSAGGRKDSSVSSSSGGSPSSPSLLGFGSGSPPKNARSSSSSPPSASPLPFTLTTLPSMIPIPRTQQELGSAALRVGGSVVSGVRFWGGVALEAAKSRMGSGVQHDSRERGVRGFFSRSAPSPTAASREEEEDAVKRRRFSGVDPNATIQDLRLQNKGAGGVSLTPNTLRTGRPEKGYVVLVVDLGSLLDSRGAADGDSTQAQQQPSVVAEFVGSRSQPIAKLAFSRDGCWVMVVPRDGYVTKVFQLRPGVLGQPLFSPDYSLAGVAAGEQAGLYGGSSVEVPGAVVPLYELRRGRLKAVVEEIDVVGDARWTGVATRNRTIHVFATNPLGGKSHHASHLEGRVRNGENIPFQHAPKLELAPLVRLYGSKLAPSSDEDPPPPLSFTFVDASDTALPTSLAPTPRLPTSPLDSISSTAATGSGAQPSSLTASPPPLSPLRQQLRTPKNHQDVLLFDAATGILALQRITVEQRAKSEGSGVGITSVVSAAALLGGSLPGMGGGAGAVSMSSSLSSNSGRGVSIPGGVAVAARPVEDVYELVGRASVVATWNLQRRKSWEEIKGVGQGQSGEIIREPVSGEECLAHAELSTFSKSRSALARPIYLSHQFSFQTLGEDYHALIRKYRLDVDGVKIDVRKDVPIQAFTSATSRASATELSNEPFVEGFSPPRHHHRARHHAASSSFDEPLASALSGELDYQPPAAVLPMYPNGVPGRSFRNSIPIRTMAGLGDGVSEGLGKIRREVVHHARMRSPRLGPRVDGTEVGDVLLEFDEDVDDFMAPRFSVAAGVDDDIVGKVDEEIWDGWDNQDKMAVEEAEQFHTISTAQYVDDPLHAKLPSSSKAKAQAKKASKKRR